jgi:hypothetical protein
MHSRFVLASIVFLAALLTCNALLAASCLADPEDQVKGADILNYREKQTLLASTRLPDCSQLAIVRGISMYNTKPRTASRARPAKIQMPTSHVVSPPALGRLGWTPSNTKV